MRINNAPKFVRRRVLVAFWGAILIAEAFWITPMLYAALDASL